MSSKLLILVTGISGLVGSKVVIELLKAGCRVRGTARGPKAELLRTTLSSKYPLLEIVVVDDIAGDGVKNVLGGVDAVIHTASPLAGKETPEQMLESSLNGTLNILRNATEAGIRKLILTSSLATTMDPDANQAWQGLTLNKDSWGQATREDVLCGKLNPLEVYSACKTLTERAVWDFAATHPQVDITTINPPFIYGPMPEGFPTPLPTNLGSNVLIYQLIHGEGGRPLPPQFPPYSINVLDVARAHVAAIELSREAVPMDKRFIICSGAFLWSESVKYIIETRSELKDRLPSVENSPHPGPLSTIDTSFAARYLHMDSYISWQETVDSTLDSLLKAEKTWK